jgi:hypothetical protein
MPVTLRRSWIKGRVSNGKRLMSGVGYTTDRTLPDNKPDESEVSRRSGRLNSGIPWRRTDHDGPAGLSPGV